MKKNKLLVLMLVVAILIGTICIFTACDDDNEPTYYTVEFNTDGAGTIASQSVEEGKTVTQPAQPTKEGYVFNGWYNGETLYEFSSAVKSDLTLVAKWTRQYTVTFKSDGAVLSTSKVLHGDRVEEPVNNPLKADHYFNGWKLNGSAYNFDTAVTSDLVIEADWISNATLSSALQTALSADYSNYTMVYSISEVEDHVTYTMTYTYKRAGNDYYTKLEQEGLPTVERWVVFDNGGKVLDCFYKNNAGDWKRSEGDVIYYYIPFKYTELTSSDFTYSMGAYSLEEESMSCFEYETFGTYNELSLSSVFVFIESGIISHIEGMADNGDLTFTQDISEVGSTELTRPELPKSVVTISLNKLNGEDEAGVKTVTEGTPVTMTQIKALFALKIDGISHSEKITDSIIDIGELDLGNPVAGTYPITISYTAWDCATPATASASVVVNARPQEGKSLSEILAEDYTNATIKIGAYTIARDGNFYYMKSGVTGYYLWVDSSLTDGYGRAVTDRNNNITSTDPSSVAWRPFLRLDLVTSLDASLFTDNGDGTYTLSSTSNPTQEVKDTLLNIFFNAYNKTSPKPATASIKMSDTTKPYSLILEVKNDKLSKVTVSYYHVNALITSACTISDIGATATIVAETKEKIQKAFEGYDVTYKCGDHGIGVDFINEKQPCGPYKLAKCTYDFENGYVFIGWKEEGGSDLIPEESVYTLSKDVTFVAQWARATTVTYKPGDHAQGENKVMSNIPAGDYKLSYGSMWMVVDENYMFIGWKVEGGDGTLYKEGETFNLTADTVFIAQWKDLSVGTPTFTSESAVGLGSSPMKKVTVIAIDFTTGEVTLTYTTSQDSTPQTITTTAVKGTYSFGYSELEGYKISDPQISSDSYIIKIDDDKLGLSIYDWDDEEGTAGYNLGSFKRS